MTPASRERLRDLLCDQALWGLDETEARELEQLRAHFGRDAVTGEPSPDDQQLGRDLDEIAALATIGLLPSSVEPVPDALVKDLEAEALGFVAARKGIAPEKVLDAIDDAASGRIASTQIASTRIDRVEDTDDNAPIPIAFLPLAAAAAIIVALLWLGYSRNTEEQPSRARERMLAQSSNVLRMDWARGASPFAGLASGDVVWSDELQTGYMRFRGLPVNDSNLQQYQLWIFDKTRDAARPVDGGVFDVPDTGDSGDIVVPIRAALRVGEATAFAVTVERPGGVVVSDREHVVATAGL